MLVSIPLCLWLLSIWVVYNLFIILWFIHYVHMASYRRPTIKQVWQLIQQGDYAFPLILRMLTNIFILSSIIFIFMQFVWQNKPYEWKVLPFGLATPPRVFISPTKLILFLFHHKGFHLIIYLDAILVLVQSRCAGKRTYSFLCSLLVCLGLQINFSRSELHLNQWFCFLGFC